MRTPWVIRLLLALWPLHANGVRGNAVRPDCVEYGWSSYAPLPEGPLFLRTLSRNDGASPPVSQYPVQCCS